MKKIVLQFSFLLLSVVFLGCTARNVSVEKPVPGSNTQVTQVTSKEGWQKQWEVTILEAKKEKVIQIHIVASISSVVRQELSRQVKDKYGLELEILSGRANELAQKLIRERRASLYLADLYIGGATTVSTMMKPAGTLESLEPALILPEVKDPRVWVGERLPFVDKDKTIFAFSSYVNSALAVNAETVKKEEIQSFRDFLDPRWKGKIAMSDPSIGGSGGMWASAMGLQVLGADYLRELARQDVMFTRDLNQLAYWLTKGKYPITIGLTQGILTDYIRAGVPLYKPRLKEGGYLASGSGNLALYNKAPHPNAARVFINWLLSREGQIVFSKGMDTQSSRLDVPTDFLLDQDQVRVADMQYFNTSKEEFQLKVGEDHLIFKEIFNIK